MPILVEPEELSTPKIVEFENPLLKGKSTVLDESFVPCNVRCNTKVAKHINPHTNGELFFRQGSSHPYNAILLLG